MRKLIVKPLALQEQRQTLQHSRKMFGSRAARAYEALIRRAYRALCADPKRAGVVVSDDDATLTILRVLHDSMDITQHASSEDDQSGG